MNRRAAAFGAALALAGTAAFQASRAADLEADLTEHEIRITTGFTGATLTLFGSVSGEGEVAVVVRGPPRDATVRRKDEVAGVWINRASARFPRIPSFYFVAQSAPLEGRAPAAVLDLHDIYVENLELETADPDAEAFRAALVRKLQEENLYVERPQPIASLGERLFRTDVAFPSNVPTGVYLVSVYLIQEGREVEAQTTPLLVNKIGLGAWIAEQAQRRAPLYGLAAVIGALAMGWFGSLLFRKG